MKNLPAILLLLFSLQSLAQKYPQDYFRSPIDSPLNLSTNFGMLREDHFHFGLDIRTNGEEGMPVYAVADGYVVRIKVSAYGYGRALYINHPNGYTSVYAHLQRYNDTLAAWTLKRQYDKESFEVDLFPERNKLKVSKGDLIGYSGNSGGSSGPHLHFEIRDTKTEYIINPELFGIKVIDTLAPVFLQVAVYSFDARLQEGILVENDMDGISLDDDKFAWSGVLRHYKGIYPVSPGKIGFLANVYDKYADGKYDMMPFRQTLKYDGEIIFEQQIVEYSFNHNRYVNVHIEYTRYILDDILDRPRERFQKFYVDAGNELPFYKVKDNKGIIFLDPADTGKHQVEYEASDLSGHVTKLKFYIRAKTAKQAIVMDSSHYSLMFLRNKANEYSTDEIKVEIPEMAFYNDSIGFHVARKSKNGDLFPAFDVSSEFIPLHRSITLSIKPGDKIPQSWYPKLLIAGKSGAVGGNYKDGFVTTRVNRFGYYRITIDTVIPEIKPLNLTRTGIVKDSAFVAIEIKDTLSGITFYRATIDDKFFLMEYDAKNNLLKGYFQPGTSKGPHDFVLTVGDRKQNYNKFRSQIIIK